MRAGSVLKSLGPIDAASVRRDSFLRWMLFMPVFLALFLRWFAPWLNRRLQGSLSFELAPYYPLVMSYFIVLLIPLMFGLVIGFLLLDEKDDDTLTALQITPLPMASYLVYRIALPLALSTVLMVVVVPLTGLSRLGLGPLVVLAVASAPLAPLFALFIASFAANKVQGFALMKGLGGLLLVPNLAWFVSGGWQLAFGLVPTYWPVKLYWVLEAGEPGAWLYLVVGWLYQLLLLAYLLRRFNRVLHQ